MPIPNRRWRPRFGLRTLLLLMTAACIAAAIGKRHYDASAAQAAAVKTLAKLGISVAYDYQVVSIPKTLPDADSIWKWQWSDAKSRGISGRLREAVGVDFCSDVIALTAFEDGFHLERHTRKEYALLKSLPRLRTIDVFDSYFCVDGLVHCIDHQELVSLNVNRIGLQDKHLDVICKLPRLRTLSMEGSEITDAGAEQLKTMTQLKYLWVVNSRISREMIAELKAALPGCQVIGNEEFEAMQRQGRRK